MEIGCPLRNAGCLLHRMRNNADRIALSQLVDQVLDASSRNRIQRRAGLVHQDNFGIDGNRARDTQPLLLTPGQTGAGLMETILDLLPQPGPPQADVDDLVELTAIGGKPVNPRAVGDILVNRFRERIGLLENHTHL